MSVIHILPNGDVVPVPQDVVSQGNAAQQAFYDLQLERIKAESVLPEAPAAPVEE